MSIKADSVSPSADNAVLEKAPAIGFSLLLGAFLFYGVAFAGPTEIHNAAHDGRHVFSFPCH